MFLDISVSQREGQSEEARCGADVGSGLAASLIGGSSDFLLHLLEPVSEENIRFYTDAAF